MTPPPVTPNPHRFLPLRRDGHGGSKPGLSATSNHQFAPTPNFVIPTSRARIDHNVEQSSIIGNSTPVISTREGNLDSILRDNIVDSSPVEGDEESFGHNDSYDEYRQEEKSLLSNDVSSPNQEHLPKRRKIGPSELSSLQDRTFILSSATQPKLLNRHLGAYGHSTTDDVESVPIVTKDTFLTAAPASNQMPSDPLPAVFSPHRRHQKFLSSGMAASMRSHVMDLSSAQHHVHLKSLVFKVISISTSRSPDMSAVLGITTEDEKINLILAGPGQRPQTGEVFTVHGIHWPVEISEKQWIVCIEWKVNP